MCDRIFAANMDLDSVLEGVLRSRGQGNLTLKPKQKEALQSIVFNSQDCLIVLPTGYGKSLIYQKLLLSLFDKNYCEGPFIEGQVNCNCCFSSECLN